MLLEQGTRPAGIRRVFRNGDGVDFALFFFFKYGLNGF